MAIVANNESQMYPFWTFRRIYLLFKEKGSAEEDMDGNSEDKSEEMPSPRIWLGRDYNGKTEFM